MGDFRFGREALPQQRPPVSWYHPLVLLKAALHVLSSLNQFRNRDERESFSVPLTVIDRSQRADQDFWFDFLADTGDGGNATYAVARTALADQVHGDTGEVLRRGELLLLGGDLAYPSASSLDYRYRFVEMFEAALPEAPQRQFLVRGQPLTLAAVPQNHDWMDSASTFGRYFMRNKSSRALLGASIPQRQSYFCVRLPHGWWALGLDFAMTGDIDRDQYEQFQALLTPTGLQAVVDGQSATYRLQPGDRVILIYPEPVWTTPVAAGVHPGGAKRYQLLEALLQPHIALRLAGDLHHYMRWTSARDGQLVTCGSGGAFTHPTHCRVTSAPIVARRVNNDSAIPASTAAILQLGIDDGQAPDSSQAFEKVRGSEFPSQAQSRRLALCNLWALFSAGGSFWQGNRWFAALMGLLYLIGAGLHRLPFGLLASGLLFWGLCLSMAWESLAEASPRSPRWRAYAVTLATSMLHAACHLAALAGLSRGLTQLLASAALADPAAGLWQALGLLVAGAGCGTLIFGAYLACMSWAGYLLNNGFSALALQDFKGLLRMRIDPDGRLHAYFIAIDRVPRVWGPGPQAQPVWQPMDQALRGRVHDQFVICPDDPLGQGPS